MSDLKQGEVKYLAAEKGYGFIRVAPGKPDCFFHASRLIGVLFDDLHIGDQVEYDTELNDRGVAAFDVKRTASVETAQ